MRLWADGELLVTLTWPLSGRFQNFPYYNESVEANNSR